MKIGIVSDTHLGYARFEEDAFRQAEYALKDAETKCDLIIVAGDVFDVKIPKLETIKRAVDIFSRIKKPIYIIHGNHERRSKDMVNPVELLAKLSNLKYLHNESSVLEVNGERVFVLGLGSVPEDFAKASIRKVCENVKVEKEFRILVIHQSIKELVYGNEDELSLDDLRELPFDLIVNGHIHRYHSELNGKLIIPGSTVITQLRSDEQGERGYIIYDTNARTHEFVVVPSRLFFYEELKFMNASIAEVKEAIEKKISEIRGKHKDAIVKIKLNGTLKEGLTSADISLAYSDGIYIQNNINVESISEKIKKMREKYESNASVREVAVRRLGERVNGKITLFDPVEFFEKLTEGAEEGLAYIDEKILEANE